MTSFLPIIGMVVSIFAQLRSMHNGVLQLMRERERERERESKIQNIDNNVANQIDKY